VAASATATASASSRVALRCVLNKLLSLLALIAVIESENVCLLICATDTKMCLGVSRTTLPHCHTHTASERSVAIRGMGERLSGSSFKDNALRAQPKNSLPHVARCKQHTTCDIATSRKTCKIDYNNIPYAGTTKNIILLLLFISNAFSPSLLLTVRLSQCLFVYFHIKVVRCQVMKLPDQQKPTTAAAAAAQHTKSCPHKTAGSSNSHSNISSNHSNMDNSSFSWPSSQILLPVAWFASKSCRRYQ